MKAKEVDKRFSWLKGKGFYKDGVCIANFVPVLKMILETQEGKVLVIELYFATGPSVEVRIPIEKIKRIDWFYLCSRCIVEEENKNAQKAIKEFLCKQVTIYEEMEAMIPQYRKLGWNVDVFGNNAYAFGNRIVGGDKRAKISPVLQEYKLQICEERQDEFIASFVELLERAPSEAVISIGYFFTGLIRQLYKDAGVPVDFVLYLLGEQQSRKTTLAKLTNNLYCRRTDMDFSIRTVEKTSKTTAEKLITEFKDTTLILDDVSRTSDKKYRERQEAVIESVTRMIGNKTRKSSNYGNVIKEFFPNANIVITGEYLPEFPESTLSRMVIVQINRPIDSEWLTDFEQEPEMLSTVAYSFISWILMHYEKYIVKIRSNFKVYRQRRAGCEPYQERIQEHGFILQSTYYILNDFLYAKGYTKEIYTLQERNADILHRVLEKQVQIMEKYALPKEEQDYCYALAKLYCEKELGIADSYEDYNNDSNKDRYDGFKLDKNTICISTAKMCAIMQVYYKDTRITIRKVTKQLRTNRFLKTDNCQNSKSTKKINHERYLHIVKGVVKDYYEYCCIDEEVPEE